MNNNYRWRMLMLAIAADVAVAAMAQAAQPVGLLSMVAGDVQIYRAGQSAAAPARTADLIAAGDRVVTGKNSEATFLFCPESRSAKLIPDSEAQFNATAVAVKKGKLTDEKKVPTCRLPQSLALAGASQMQSGMMRLRAGERLVLRSPSHTAIAVAQPTFQWSATDGATSYELRVQDREEKILWKQTVAAATEVQYPADAAKLAWGQKYFWNVTARQGEEPVDQAASFFQLLPADQAEQVRTAEASLLKLREDNPSDNGPLFLLAFLYEDNGMLDQAVRVYSELKQRMGPQDWLDSRINELTGKLGWERVETGSSQ